MAWTHKTTHSVLAILCDLTALHWDIIDMDKAFENIKVIEEIHWPHLDLPDLQLALSFTSGKSSMVHTISYSMTVWVSDRATLKLHPAKCAKTIQLAFIYLYCKDQRVKYFTWTLGSDTLHSIFYKVMIICQQYTIWLQAL